MTVSATTPAENLPVPVLDHPHWRVNFRPAAYDPKRLKNVSECLDVLHKTRVRLRGWDFPYLPSQESELKIGDTWIAGWSWGRLEYWRFYQSTQFIYLGSIREVTDAEWDQKLRQAMKWHGHARDDIDSVPGFLSLTNSIYTITEFFEFAARLAQAQVYLEPVTVTIAVKGISGFMLAADQNRSWSSDYVARESDLTYTTTLTPAELISSAAEHAVTCTIWLFERFGWLRPNIDVIRTDQQKLLTRQL